MKKCLIIFPGLFVLTGVFVIGHTDKSGSNKYKREPGVARAGAVFHPLITCACFIRHLLIRIS